MFNVMLILVNEIYLKFYYVWYFVVLYEDNVYNVCMV